MDKKTVPLVVLAIALCAVLVLGEVFAYGINPHNYGIKAEFSSGTLNYSVSSSGSDTYSAVLLDNDGVAPTKELYIYADENYDNHYKEAFDKSSARYIRQQYYAEQVKKSLELKGFNNVRIIDSNGLKDVVTSSADNPGEKGLVITSYALPSEIYTGKADDPMIKWIGNGGRLYWSASEIGRFYTDSNGLHEVSGNQILFFGKECVNKNESVRATSAIENGFYSSLSLINSSIEFSIDTTDIPDSLSIGYCKDGYSSISFIKHGNGMICVMGSMFEFTPQFDDLSQIIASGITYSTKIIESVKGNVVRGTVNGTISYTPSGSNSAYIYIGGTYTIIGRCFYD